MPPMLETRRIKEGNSRFIKWIPTILVITLFTYIILAICIIIDSHIDRTESHTMEQLEDSIFVSKEYVDIDFDELHNSYIELMYEEKEMAKRIGGDYDGLYERHMELAIKYMELQHQFIRFIYNNKELQDEHIKLLNIHAAIIQEYIDHRTMCDSLHKN